MSRSLALRILLCCCALVVVSGCATPPTDDAEALAEFEAVNDPLEPMNRAIFDFNQSVDRAVIRPVAEGYRWAFPEFFRDIVHNILANASEPVNFFNAVLQGNPERAATVLGRVLINSTMGVGGMVDFATMSGIRAVDEDFGQTVGVWGGGEGAYLVLPILGPSSIRDGAGKAVDSFMNPLSYVYANADIEYVGAITGFVGGIDLRSRNIQILDEIERTSVDYYATLRSLYRQRRQDLINNGEPSIEVNPFLSLNDEPEIFDDSVALQ
jgi:phospholipid-binding lipoprotein MlaA